jgi:peptidoglycan/xylan/chitin deacetylase (PgdA/CDA1 family)
MKKAIALAVILIFIFSMWLLIWKLVYHYSSEDVYAHGNRGENKIALTFDDGPVDKTLEILDILKEENVSATFFVIGRNVIENPRIFEKLIESGNEIGSHSYNHLKLNLKSRGIIKKEIEANDFLFKEYGISTNLFRPTSGFVDLLVDSETKRLGKKIVLWDVDPKDWKNPGVEKVVQNVLENVRNGSIILFHDYADYEKREMNDTFKALRILIPELKKKYKLVTVSELLG